MALDQKFFKKSTTAATGLADQEQGLVLHLDANDVDSYDGDGSIWYDITNHEVNVPLTDNDDNLEIHIDASNNNSYPGYGSTITDISTNGHSFSTHGNATFGSDLRGYFTLDGSDDDLRTTNAVTGFSGDVTFEWWFNASESNNFALLHANPASNDSGINGIFIGNAAGSAGAIEIYRRTTGGTLHSGATSSTGLSGMASDGWVHFVITITSANVCKFYKDGSYTGTLTLNGNGTNHDTYNFVSIGGYNNASYEFAGKIGCFRMYSEILTASDIGQNYRAGNFLNYSSIITSKHEATQGSLVTTPPTQGTLYTSNLAFHLDANGHSGTYWTDSVGSINGTINGATYVNNDNSDYFTFDGSDDTVTFPASDTSPINFSSETHTIEFWVNFNTLANDDVILGKFGGSNTLKSFQIQVSSTNKLTVLERDGGSNNTFETTGTFSTGTWTHFAYTRSASTIKLYINGTLDKSDTAGNAINAGSTQDITIGNQAGEGVYFDGKLAQLRIYSSTLDSSQVLTNYNATKSLYQEITALVASYDANGYSGSGNWLDTSGNGKHLTIAGSATYTNNDNSDYFLLDGTDDKFSNADIDLNSNDITMEAWVWLDHYGTGDGTSIVHLGTPSSAGTSILFRERSNGKLSVYDFGSGNLDTDNVELSLNTWHHVALTVTGTTYKLYVDGVEKKSGTRSTYSGDDRLIIGNYNNVASGSASQFWDGKIAQVRIYRGAMSLSQVVTNYNATKALYQNPTAKMYLDAGDNSTVTATTWSDKVNSNDGTLTGFSSTLSDFYDEELGNSIEFDGSNDIITVSYNASLYMTSNTGFAIETWVNRDSNSEMYIIASDDGSTFPFALQWNSTTHGYYGWISGSSYGGAVGLNETSTNGIGKWDHVVIAQSSSDRKNRLYVNGILTSTSAAVTGFHSTSSGVNVGAYHNETGKFDGKMGVVRIYQSELTAAQVAQNYLATKNDYPNGNNATIGGPPTWSTNSNPAYNYWNLDASSEYFTIPDSSVFDLINEQSMEVWLYRVGTGVQYIIDKATNSTSNYGWQFLYSTSGNGGYFFQMHNAPYSGLANPTVSSTVNTWEHIVVTCNGNNEYKLYKNGSLGDTQSVSGNVARTTVGLTIGRYSLTGGNQFTGRFGMIKFYDKTLSATEVTAAYNNTKGTYGIT